MDPERSDWPVLAVTQTIVGDTHWRVRAMVDKSTKLEDIATALNARGPTDGIRT